MAQRDSKDLDPTFEAMRLVSTDSEDDMSDTIPMQESNASHLNSSTKRASPATSPRVERRHKSASPTRFARFCSPTLTNQKIMAPNHQSTSAKIKAFTDDQSRQLVKDIDNVHNWDYDDSSHAPHSNKTHYKLKAPKPYALGDCFQAFRLLFLNYIHDAQSVHQQKAILLSLIDEKIFTIAHPIVSKGENIRHILNELQSLFSPEEEMSTKLTNFQSLKQLPGESINQYAIRIADKGRQAYPNLPDESLQAYLVMQFISGLQDINLKSTIRMLGPQSLQQAITLVKRSQPNDMSQISISMTTIPNKQQHLICQLCNRHGHGAIACRKYNIAQKKANPNGFTTTQSTDASRDDKNNGNRFNRKPQFGQYQPKRPFDNNWQRPASVRFQQRPYQSWSQTRPFNSQTRNSHRPAKN